MIIVSVLILGICSVTVLAGTLDDIKTNVKANYNAIDDLTCDIDITYTNGPQDWNDFDAADFWSKGTAKIRIDGTGSDVRETRANGSYWWTKGIVTPLDEWQSCNQAKYEEEKADCLDEMGNHNALIDDNTWSLDPNTHTIGGISAYRIYSTDYDMYVDVSTKTKVLKIDYNTGSETEYVEYSDYSYLESTAYVPATTTHVYDTSTSLFEMSSININESLADSLFEVS